MSEKQVESSLSETPPAPPRAVTARGRRRSWGEPGVRTWWLTGLVLAVIAGSLTAGRLMGSAEDRDLARRGRKVEAKIVRAGDMKLPGRVIGPEFDATFTLRFDLGGTSHDVQGKLKQQRGLLGPGMTLPLLVDPNDPSNFTDRLEISWQDDLFVLLLVGPVVALLLGVAIVRRVLALRTWRDGEAMAAVVVETKQAAAAPLSRLVRYTLRDAKDNRVFSTFVPTRVGVLETGDVFWVVAANGNPGRAVVAALYA